MKPRGPLAGADAAWRPPEDRVVWIDDQGAGPELRPDSGHQLLQQARRPPGGHRRPCRRASGRHLIGGHGQPSLSSLETVAGPPTLTRRRRAAPRPPNPPPPPRRPPPFP